MEEEQSPFLRLPAEIRLMIYHLLLVPSQECVLAASNTKRTACLSYYDYEPNEANKILGPILQIRTLDPFHEPSALRPALHESSHLRRARFAIRDHYRARTMKTTYTVENNPGIYANILGACRQIHAEAAPVLYGAYTWDFDTHVEAIVPFFMDLSPLARKSVRRVGLVKKAMPYEREFDRCEWDISTSFLAQSLPSLRRLELGVVAGKPGPQGWDELPQWRKEELKILVRRSWDGLEWVAQVARIKIESVGVRAIVEHCLPPNSESMAFWVSLSKSLEGGFADWLREMMVVNGAS